MEVLVKYENGYRFTATCKGFTVSTGRGDDGKAERDGMWPAQMFSASVGMCIGGYIAEFCKKQSIPFGNMTIELSRRTQAEPSHTSRIDVSILLDAELSQQQQRGILKAANNCHITKSIEKGMQIVCSLSGTKVDNG